jgi:hypothetical protein
MKMPCLCSLSYHKFDTSNYVVMPPTALQQEVATLRARIAALEAPPSEGEICSMVLILCNNWAKINGGEFALVVKDALEKYQEGRR